MRYLFPSLSTSRVATSASFFERSQKTCGFTPNRIMTMVRRVHLYELVRITY